MRSDTKRFIMILCQYIIYLSGVMDNMIQNNTNFGSFFKKATEHVPFPYQVRLANSSHLPLVLNIPTGLGKTDAVILSWVWRRCFAEQSIRDSTPRRLIYCLPMRVLVEQTRTKVEGWLQNLEIFSEVSEENSDKISVTTIMGGEDKDDWDYFPEHNAIVIGTQDMLLSRALNRGYGMSRYRWPIHYALLNNDCFWIMDEIQLMGVGLETSTQLQGLREKLGSFGNTETLWMSATVDMDRLTTIDSPISNSDIFELDGEDKKQDIIIKCINAKKPVEKLKANINDDNYYEEIAYETIKSHEKGTLSLVIINTVGRARKVYQAIKKIKKDTECILIHSQFRFPDRQDKINFMFNKGKDRIVVSTQVVEAGADISAALLITEIAPWPSLVQRFGRCNRYGEYNNAKVIWADTLKPEGNKGRGKKKDFDAPYAHIEIDKARELISNLEDADIKNLQRVSQNYMPSNTYHQVIRKRDVIDLFDTTPDLTGNDLDISRYIRDGNDTNVKVFWRKEVSNEYNYQSNPPRKKELCNVPISDVRDLLKNSKPGKKQQGKYFWQWDPLKGQLINLNTKEDGNKIVPGRILLLDCNAGHYNDEIGWDLSLDNRKVEEVIDEKPEKNDMKEGDTHDSDDQSHIERSIQLYEHSKDVEKQAVLLSEELNLLDDDDKLTLKTAALWHDVGKLHPIFQDMLYGEENRGLNHRELLAKSKGYVNKPKKRYFRHELASALAWIQEGDGEGLNKNLIMYMIAASHGKIRLILHPLHSESNNKQFMVRGIINNDTLPKFPPLLPNGATMDLSLMKLGKGSWLERTLSLRDDPNIGPFRLGYYEMLLRIADWITSKKEMEGKI